MTPEEKARVLIDKQLNAAGWEVVSRNEHVPNNTDAIKESLMQGNTESDYLLFVDNKAIAVVEAKREENELGDDVAKQAEDYAINPQNWYKLWKDKLIPLVYLANGKKILFKNMLNPDSDYVEISKMHSPKKMLKMIGEKSDYGALPRIEHEGLRDCQYDAEVALEDSLKQGKNKSLAVLATGAGKTYLACMASYRMLNYTKVGRVLFLVDRNNLGKQAKTEFSLFDKTETGESLNTIYNIERLTKPENANADIVISTIQKLFAVLTGANMSDDVNEDAEDEFNTLDNEINEEAVILNGTLKLPRNYFQFIVVDECHRSIYGKWKAVLNYFNEASVLGLTATPTAEAYAYFDNNIVENYTYEDSVIDGVNVPSRVYRIETAITKHGGEIEKGTEIIESKRINGNKTETIVSDSFHYEATELDRSVVNPSQIKTVLETYRDSIYTDLYPDREENWNYIPKTLIFAKNDKHADQIVDICKEVFGEKFSSGKVPGKYVQKITYSAGNSDDLIRDFRIDKDFRIAVTVTLVATGTDIKPLECVMFMADVRSEVLYTQMKGRGCRTLKDSKLKEVTPNANTKECYYIIDAIGVTEHDHIMPSINGSNGHKKKLTLELLLEHLSHGDVCDENLMLLRDYCSTINNRYEDNSLFGKHLNEFINDYGFAPKELANDINVAFVQQLLPPYDDVSGNNSTRMNLISRLNNNVNARNKLLEMYKGYQVFTTVEDDQTVYAGFSKETARNFITTFEAYLEANKDKIEALRIIYNTEDTVITYSMLTELYGKLLNENKEYKPSIIWNYYKVLDSDGKVDELNTKYNVNALTNLIQIARYAYKKNGKLTSLYGGFLQRFNLFCGRSQRILTEDQKTIMKKIAEYIVEQGSITANELNAVDADLWRQGILNFGLEEFKSEMNILSKFILRMA